MTTEQMTLPLIFLSGVLGSAHCIGMCGGIAATMSLGANRLRTAMLRQLLWSLGRTFTYAFLGIAVASLGSRLIVSGSHATLTQAAFAVVAGMLLVFQGLHAAGWLRWAIRRKAHHACMTTSILSQFLRGGSSVGVFIAGILTGFLPCGLVYSFLALAAASGNPLHGVVIMLCFGLGPYQFWQLTGLGFSVATLNLRQQLLKIAAVCVMVTGLMTVGRGIAFASVQNIQASTEDGTSLPTCPICSEEFDE